MTSRTLVTLAIVGAAVVLAAVVGIVVRDGRAYPRPNGTDGHRLSTGRVRLLSPVG